ncbi:MAG: 3-methyl-2-oxobutanoate hydroxymethyltransferase [Gammaproteobacteria bacterium]|nr:3-methyl-2-oxobutanoate hydroxymethyltransferase [Gammaproteobacteria bacterium]
MNNKILKIKNMKKDGDKIACLTAYDASFASILEKNNIDIILVGDSLGMIFQGYKNTHEVRIEHIIYHLSCVSKKVKKSLLMADLPKDSYNTKDDAYKNSKFLLDTGAEIVKIEFISEHEEIVSHILNKGIPVCAHIGLKPQYINDDKEIIIYGKDKETARELSSQAKLLENLGVDVLLLECVEPSLSKEISDLLDIPVIGIGSGNNTDGQIQVLYDILGITECPPNFSKNFLDRTGSIDKAIESYVKFVKDK